MNELEYAIGRLKLYHDEAEAARAVARMARRIGCIEWAEQMERHAAVHERCIATAEARMMTIELARRVHLGKP